MKGIWADTVADEISDYNTFVREAQEFIEEMRDEMQAYYDDRSEKWQESDTGTEYYDWIDAWETGLDEIEDIQPEEIDCPDFDAVETILNYPQEP